MKYLVLAVLLFSLALVSADMISPGTKKVSIENKITNINDFPEYTFIVIGSWGDDNYNSMCGWHVLNSNGIINGGYRCSSSVYAIGKQDFNESIFSRWDDTEVEGYLNSYATEVIKNIKTSETVGVSDPSETIKNSYEIDINEIKIKPNNTEIERNYLIYFYILVPILGVIIFAIILIKRRKDGTI